MRLIDADAVMKFWYRDEEHEESIGEFLKSFCDEPIPTVDAVPVVRCRDCEHCDCLPDYMGFFYCDFDEGRTVSGNGFCDVGERRSECGE